ncbi:MAG: hypothetical protein AB1792_01365 [Candidatus Zixiibacteriota bacterium]
MNRWLIVTEGGGAGRFDPLDLVRPGFLLRDGAFTVAQRWMELLRPAAVSVSVRPWLAASVAEETGWDVNRLPAGPLPDDLWVFSGVSVPVDDPRWADLSFPPRFVWDEGGAVAMRFPAASVADVLARLRPWIESGAQSAAPIAIRESSGTLPLYAPAGLWHLISELPTRLAFDWQLWNRWQRPSATGYDPELESRQGSVVLGRESVWRGRDVVLHPHVVIDARTGPVWLDDGVVIESFTRLDGPAYVGRGTSLLGGKLTGGCALGPGCKIGGEWEASIAQGFVNKAHAGFFGHGYLGEWVNLGAMTTNSDLKNTYGSVRIARGDETVDTGLMKVGSYLADHTKTGIGTLIPTGATWGAGVNLFGGGLGPKSLPSFVWGEPTALAEHDLAKMLKTAGVAVFRRAAVLERVGRPTKLTAAQAEALRAVYARTAGERGEFLSQWRARRSAGE